jgi:putative ABC transport system permease protein
MNFLQITSCIELGLIYSLVAIAIFLSFRIINFADLTVDGSFPLGAAVMAVALTKGINIPISMIMALLSGMLAGAITGYLNIRYKIMEILAGILTMTALYSINLRIMGKPNITLINNILLSESQIYKIICFTVFIIAIIMILFLKTQIGIALRAVGQNPKFASSNGINVGIITILTLSISNGLVALSGALFVLMQNFADISMGVGTIIIGLASVIIGEKLTSSRSTSILILAMIAGAIIYRLIILCALNLEFLNLEASDLNLISTILLSSIMIIPKFYKRAKKK